jgi:glycosyltransferase involved in cell wall biosynthesis
MGAGKEEFMKLHTVFITYNRLELTKRAIASYLETVSVPYQLCVVDNASTDGTQEWIMDQGFQTFHLMNNNVYPGMATNIGWSVMNTGTHLHRADNDFIFLPGWCEEVERVFSENPNLGQLGMRTDEEELHNTHNTGGNCIIPRRLWDEGMRWDERPWPEIKTAGYTEDSYFSPEVVRRGYEWRRVERPCVQSISVESPGDEYYRKSWADRGIVR